MNTNKVKLRALELEDVEKVFVWENDQEQWNVGVNNHYYSRYAIENYVLSAQNEDVFYSCQVRNMIENEDSQSIGCVDLYDIDARHSKAGVGIYIDKDFRQQGYAKQSLCLLESYALEILCLHQLYAVVGEDNESSINLFAECGYTQVATLQDWLRKGKEFKNALVFQKIL